jgi:hypothetical protein
MKILSTVFLGKVEQQDPAVIEYTAASRGFYRKPIQTQILISKDSVEAPAVATKIAADDWEESEFVSRK